MAAVVPEYTPSTEELPAYSATHQKYSFALIKSEFASPYHMDKDKQWRPVLIELNTTQLNVFALDLDRKLRTVVLALYKRVNGLDDLYNDWVADTNAKVFGKVKKAFGAPDDLAELGRFHSELRDNAMLFEAVSSSEQFHAVLRRYRGSLEASYTLHNLQVGEAASVHQVMREMQKEDVHSRNNAMIKCRNVLRLRVECRQLLLQFWSFHGMVHWYRALVLGKDLAAPLETRGVTKLKSLPSRYSVRNNALMTASLHASVMRRRGTPYTSQLVVEDLMEDDAIDGLFEDIFVSEPRDKMSGACSSPRSRSGSRCPCVSDDESVQSSVFDSASSAVSASTSVDDSCAHVVSVDKFEFCSFDNYYTALEKQYISVCIPNLNSYDHWLGQNLTMSSYQHILPKTVAKGPGDDIFIDYNKLPRYLQADKPAHTRQRACRSFLIHQNGLVSVAL
ncbi:hypothetical protein DICA3_E13674 [Diutina catenulata]